MIENECASIFVCGTRMGHDVVIAKEFGGLDDAEVKTYFYTLYKDGRLVQELGHRSVTEGTFIKSCKIFRNNL